jgi:hypothetical protein
MSVALLIPVPEEHLLSGQQTLRRATASLMLGTARIASDNCELTRPIMLPCSSLALCMR